jgi:capsular polysaccharide biosynthesis protein
VSSTLAGRVPLVLAGLASGVVLGVVVNALAADAYRATALIQVASAADPRQPSPDVAPVAADVLAESYARLVDSRAFMAQLAPRVAAGELDAEGLDARVEASRPERSSLVEVAATRSSRSDAERLAGEVANAFVTLVHQLEEQRAVRLESALRSRLQELQGTMRRTRDETRLETLRSERRALTDRLAAAVVVPGDTTSVLHVVGPGGSAEQVRPSLLRNLLGGALLGLVVGLAGAWFAERRPLAAIEPARPVEPELVPEPVPAPEPVAPTVALAEPSPGAVLRGAAWLAATVSPDVERVRFLLSDGGPDWHLVVDAPPRLAVAAWNTRTTPDGSYWLTALATNGAGLTASAEPTPVVVANGS